MYPKPGFVPHFNEQPALGLMALSIILSLCQELALPLATMLRPSRSICVSSAPFSSPECSISVLGQPQSHPFLGVTPAPGQPPGLPHPSPESSLMLLRVAKTTSSSWPLVQNFPQKVLYFIFMCQDLYKKENSSTLSVMSWKNSSLVASTAIMASITLIAKNN